MAKTDKMLMDKAYSTEDYCEIIKHVSCEGLTEWVPKLLAKGYVKSFIHGNMGQQVRALNTRLEALTLTLTLTLTLILTLTLTLNTRLDTDPSFTTPSLLVPGGDRLGQRPG